MKSTLISSEGDIILDSSKPDRTLRKLFDVSMESKLDYEPRIFLSNRISETYQRYSEDAILLSGGPDRLQSPSSYQKTKKTSLKVVIYSIIQRVNV